jgi:hypothetical protein
VDRYLADEGDTAARVLGAEEEAPRVHSTFDLHLSGQLWLFHNLPSSGLGLDTRDRTDMDYLYLFLRADADPIGFRAWLGLRDSPRYTDASPFGKFWMYEALVSAKLPGPGPKTDLILEAGKVFVPFGVDWDHTWYGSILYYKGAMFDSDWGARVLGHADLTDDLTVDGAAGWFVRSDELDGPSTLAGFGLEGSPIESPEFTDDPGTPDREQRDQWVVRGALTARLAEGLSATFGASALGARIRLSAPDGSTRFHSGAFAGSRRQRDEEADLTVGWEGVPFAGGRIPRIQLLLEHLWYDRGVPDQRGRAWLAELFLRLWEAPDRDWFRAVEIWYNYSADRADHQPDAHLHIPSLAIQLTRRSRFMVEYVSFTTSEYAVDRGLYFHLSFDF